jgi:hypothetical protein
MDLESAHRLEELERLRDRIDDLLIRIAQIGVAQEPEVPIFRVM